MHAYTYITCSTYYHTTHAMYSEHVNLISSDSTVQLKQEAQSDDITGSSANPQTEQELVSTPSHIM